MGRCILHFGMQKTGSSSIQDTLFYGLDDPIYRYFSAGEINGSRMLYTLTAGDSLANFYWGRSANGESFVKQRKEYYHRKLRRAMDRVRSDGGTLVLSGEDGWGQQEEGMCLRIQGAFEIGFGFPPSARKDTGQQSWKKFPLDLLQIDPSVRRSR